MPIYPIIAQVNSTKDLMHNLRQPVLRLRKPTTITFTQTGS